jgi:hypothetical protein
MSVFLPLRETGRKMAAAQPKVKTSKRQAAVVNSVDEAKKFKVADACKDESGDSSDAPASKKGVQVQVKQEAADDGVKIKQEAPEDGVQLSGPLPESPPAPSSPKGVRVEHEPDPPVVVKKEAVTGSDEGVGGVAQQPQAAPKPKKESRPMRNGIPIRKLEDGPPTPNCPFNYGMPSKLFSDQFSLNFLTILSRF